MNDVKVQWRRRQHGGAWAIARAGPRAHTLSPSAQSAGHGQRGAATSCPGHAPRLRQQASKRCEGSSGACIHGDGKPVMERRLRAPTSWSRRLSMYPGTRGSAYKYVQRPRSWRPGDGGVGCADVPMNRRWRREMRRRRWNGSGTKWRRTTRLALVVDWDQATETVGGGLQGSRGGRPWWTHLWVQMNNGRRKLWNRLEVNPSRAQRKRQVRQRQRHWQWRQRRRVMPDQGFHSTILVIPVSRAPPRRRS